MNTQSPTQPNPISSYHTYQPFEIIVTWLHEKSPQGSEYNQITAVLKSEKCKNAIRGQYKKLKKYVQSMCVFDCVHV